MSDVTEKDIELAEEIVHFAKRLNKAIRQAAEENIRVKIIGGQGPVHLKSIWKTERIWEPKPTP
jgi:hypothetical protein